MTLDELFRQRDELLSEARAVNEELSALKGDEADAKLSEVKEKMSQVDKLDEQIQVARRLEDAEKLSEERRETTQRVVENGGDLKYRRETSAAATSETPQVTMAQRHERQALWNRYHSGEKLRESELVQMRTRFPDEAWFGRYLRGGDAPAHARYQGDSFAYDPQGTSASSLDAETGIGSGATSNSASVVPTLVFNEVFARMKVTGPMLNICRFIPTETGRPLQVPTHDDTSNSAAVVAEGNSPGTQAVVLSKVDLPAYRIAPKDVIITGEMVSDAGVDIEAYVIDLLGTQFGRGLNKLLMTGTGSSQPTGIVTAINGLAAGKKRETTSNAANLTLDEVLGAFAKIDPAYSGNLTLVLNNDLMHRLRLVKTTAGDYLWQPGLQVGMPDRLYGANVAVDENLLDTAGSNSGILGDFSRHLYRVARQMTMVRLTELYASANAVGYHTEMRAGSNVADVFGFWLLKKKS